MIRQEETKMATNGKSRSSGNTTIVGLGKVVVGVRLYPTSKSDDDRANFGSYHAHDMGKARSKLFCEICGEELQRGSPSIVKGKDVGGQIIPFTDEELKAVRKSKSGKITISGFKPVKLFTPNMLGAKKWYVGTAKDGGAQPFKYLHLVMSEKPSHVAQVSWVNTAGHDVHGIMSVFENGFLIQEIVPEYLFKPFSSVDVKDADVPTKLLPKGVEMMNAMSDDAFDHKSIVDDYPEAVDKLTGAKQMGETIPVESLPQAKQETDDLEAMLE